MRLKKKDAYVKAMENVYVRESYVAKAQRRLEKAQERYRKAQSKLSVEEIEELGVIKESSTGNTATITVSVPENVTVTA